MQAHVDTQHVHHVQYFKYINKFIVVESDTSNDLPLYSSYYYWLKWLQFVFVVFYFIHFSLSSYSSSIAGFLSALFCVVHSLSFFLFLCVCVRERVCLPHSIICAFTSKLYLSTWKIIIQRRAKHLITYLLSSAKWLESCYISTLLNRSKHTLTLELALAVENRF